MSEIQAILSKLPTAFSTVGIAVLALIVGKFFYLIANPRRSGSEGYHAAIFSGNNIALSIAVCGYLVALGIALNCGVAITGNAQWSIGTIAIGAVISILLLQVSMVINDKLIMYSIDNADAINKGNVAVAIVEAGGLVATGFMLRGVLMSDSATFLDKFIDIGFYWLIGQVLLVVGSRIYQATSRYSVNDSLSAGNLAVAFIFGGFLVAYSMVIEASLTGATSNIIGELPTIIIFSLIGLALLLIVKTFIGAIFFETTTEAAGQLVGPNLIASSVMIALGFVFAGVIDTSITKQSQFETTEETASDEKATTPSQSIVPTSATTTTTSK